MRLAAILFLTVTLHAQAPANPFGVNLGYISANTAPATWSSPESIATELRNPDPNKRLAALLLAGLTIDQAKVFATDQKTGKQYPEKQVAPIDAVQLTYAAIGTDDTVDAVVTIESG